MDCWGKCPHGKIGSRIENSRERIENAHFNSIRGFSRRSTALLRCRRLAHCAFCIPRALGNIVQEAKIAGIPSIISNNGGLPELVADGIDGVILPAVDSDTIQQAFENLLKQPENWKDYGKCSQKIPASPIHSCDF